MLYSLNHANFPSLALVPNVLGCVAPTTTSRLTVETCTVEGDIPTTCMANNNSEILILYRGWFIRRIHATIE